LKKKSIAIIASSLVLCASLLITGAATLSDKANDKVNAQEQIVTFSDVKKTDWFYEDVKYVRENNLMNGTSDTEFSPTGVTTRGMIVTILWRLEGEPVEKGTEFEDVGKDAYYYKAVAWASNNKIVSGYSETTFGPNDTATREQLATIMYRYASYKKYDVSKEAELDKYVDKDQISEYAVKSIRWANANGIISGTSADTISPKDNVQRCQVAAILKRFCNNIANVEVEEKTEEQEKVEVELPKDDDTNVSQDEPDKTPVEDDTSEDNTPPSTSTKPVTNETYTSPTIVVDKVHAKAGDEVQVAVDLKCNPGVLGMTLTLYYDDTKCSLIKAENGEILKDVLNLTTSKTLDSGARFVWDGIEITEEDIKDGEILLLTFKVNSNADVGNCPITLKYFDDDIIDNNLTGVYPYVKNGEIIISK